MIARIFPALVLTLVASPLYAANVNWTDWQSWNGTDTVQGVVDDNGTAVNVTFSSTANLSPSPQLDGSGTDFWATTSGDRDPATSPYTNVDPTYGVDNVPTGTDIIRMNQASTYTLSFDQAISDIFFAFVSVNNNAFVFDTQAILLSAGGMDIDGNGTDLNGYWGGTSTTAIDDSTPGEWVLSGNGEPHGTMVLPGTFTSLTWTGGSETWHGFTMGVRGVAPPPVPVPVPALLLLSGLGGLALLRRRA